MSPLLVGIVLFIVGLMVGLWLGIGLLIMFITGDREASGRR